MIESMPADELFFFDARPAALPLYEAFRKAVLIRIPGVRIEAKKTQISFFNRRMFAAVSFTPVRKTEDRPDPFMTITFGLPYRKGSARIDAAAEPYPNRWTHHVMIGTEEEIDDDPEDGQEREHQEPCQGGGRRPVVHQEPDGND